MSDASEGLANLTIDPMPRSVVENEGTTELSEDVRLVTSNVLPIQRKAMRGIFSDAGIRVVANKKKFVIEVYVKEPGELDLANVPEAGKEGYYEVYVQDNVVDIRTLSQEGALWGAQALADIYRSFKDDGRVSNLTIRDWPAHRDRGVLIRADDDIHARSFEQWRQMMNALARVKMNHVALPWFAWDSRQQRAFLMTGLPEKDELLGEQASFYQDEENEDRPTLCVGDNYKNLVAHATERGVTLAPVIDVLGWTAPFAEWIPDVGAVSADGTSKSNGMCVDSDRGREVLEAYCTGVLETAFPTGAPCVHLQIGSVTGEDAKALQCETGACAGKAGKELEKHLQWFVDMLREKNVERILVWDNLDVLPENPGFLNEDVTVMQRDGEIDGIPLARDTSGLSVIACSDAKGADWGELAGSLGPQFWQGE